MNSRLKNLPPVEKPVEILRGKAAVEWLKNTPLYIPKGYRGFFNPRPAAVEIEKLIGGFSTGRQGACCEGRS
jgi:hypothetical protein